MPSPPRRAKARLPDHPRYKLIRRLGSGGAGTVYLQDLTASSDELIIDNQGHVKIWHPGDFNGHGQYLQ